MKTRDRNTQDGSGNRGMDRNPVKVLIVDDDGFMRKKMRTIAEKHGYLVVGELADGSTATHYLEYLHPDLVLMDVVMKDMDGATATRKIKERFPLVQILMVSTLKKGHIVRGGLAAGAYDYLPKPFTEEQLVEAMERGMRVNTLPSPAPAAAEDKANKRILIVDDDLYMRRKLRHLVEMHDLGRVMEADDGARAVDIAYLLQPDLVIMDIVMKDMDGVKATELIKKIVPHTRVLAVSALQKSETIAACLRAGACDYVSKPIDETRFLKTIRNALKAHACGGVLNLPADSEAAHLPAADCMPRVMVVDDDLMIRKLMCKILEKKGYHVVGEFPGAEEALQYAEHLQPDIILMDLMMGGMSGAVATRELKRRLPAARVIVISAIQNSSVIDGCLKNGALDYLTKPFDNDVLVHAIQRAMNAHLC